MVDHADERIDHTNLGSTLMKLMKTFFIGMTWGIPLLIMAVAWFAFPESRDTVSFDWNVWHGVGLAMFAQVVLTAVWLAGDWFTVTHYETPPRTLQYNCFVSTLAALILTGVFGWLVTSHQLPWFFLVPWLGSIFDTFFTVFISINNATQKPLMHSASRGA